MSESRPYRVFLSYSEQDRDWVSQFASALRDAGVSAWFDVSDIPAGERWDLQVQRALRESTTLIVILSQGSVKSPRVFFELGAAVAGEKRVIPVLIGDIDVRDMPLSLARIQVLREPSPVEAAKRVAGALEETEPGGPLRGTADEKTRARRRATDGVRSRCLAPVAAAGTSAVRVWAHQQEQS